MEPEALFGAELGAEGRQESDIVTRLRRELGEELDKSKKKDGATDKPHIKDLVAPRTPTGEIGGPRRSKMPRKTAAATKKKTSGSGNRK